MGGGAPHRRSAADVCDRAAGRSPDRPALAAPPDDRRRPHALRGLRRASVCDDRDAGRRARSDRRHRDRLLPAGGVRGPAEPRRRRRSLERERASPDRRQPDLGSRLSRRRRTRRGLRGGRGLLDQRVHLPDLRGLPLGDPWPAAAGHGRREPGPLARPEGRLRPGRALAGTPDRAHRLERGDVLQRRRQRGGAAARLPCFQRRAASGSA